jgi:hypothetical protein
MESVNANLLNKLHLFRRTEYIYIFKSSYSFTCMLHVSTLSLAIIRYVNTKYYKGNVTT